MVLGKAIFQGGTIPLDAYKGGMLKSFPERGSALVDFAKKFWEKLPKGMSHARDLVRKTPMGVVLLKLSGVCSTRYIMQCPRIKQKEITELGRKLLLSVVSRTVYQ